MTIKVRQKINETIINKGFKYFDSQGCLFDNDFTIWYRRENIELCFSSSGIIHLFNFGNNNITTDHFILIK